LINLSLNQIKPNSISALEIVINSKTSGINTSKEVNYQLLKLKHVLEESNKEI